MALGGMAYLSVQGIEEQVRALIAATPNTPGTSASVLLAAVETAGWQILLATLIASALMVIVSVPVMHKTVGRPLKAVAEAVTRLAGGDLEIEIDGDTRNDEIGTIVRGLNRLRDERRASGAAPIRASIAEQDAAHARSKVIVDATERFSQDFIATLAGLGKTTRQLADAADKMIVATRRANDGSDQATNASANAVGDVSSVATASEQLLDSIEEISRQVVQSTNVVRTAVERAVETNSGMGRLSSAAQKVGDVVSLISRIAAQTNLLALNATIEAARAGEAGRGFAVVAQEVKTLATQTAKATQDITGQIAEMQQATDLSVEAIDKIQHKISEVEHISTIIAAAVHEQGAATQEIARNVRSAAAGTANMSTHIENVVRSVNETSSNATSVVAFARDLDAIAQTMTTMVSSFAETVKAA